MPDNALIKATGLWAKTSGKTGRQYLVGRLGGLRVLIFENVDAGEGDPTHLLMLGEAAQPQRTDNGPDRAGRSDDQARHAQRHVQQRRARAVGEAIAPDREPDWPPPIPPGGDDLDF
jgi:hypothetical protein